MLYCSGLNPNDLKRSTALLRSQFAVNMVFSIAFCCSLSNLLRNSTEILGIAFVYNAL